MQTGEGGEPPAIIKDVPVVSGSGQITIAANGKVDTLVAIPYNTSLTSGNYSTTVSISADATNLSIIPITSKISSSLSHADHMAKFREQERQLLSALRSRGNLSNLKNMYPTNLEFIDDPNDNLTFNKQYKDSWTKVTATKKYGSNNTKCQIYLQDNVTGSHLQQDYIEQLGKAFDVFYNLETSYFGTPTGSLGDIDGNEMVYILITELDKYSDGSWIAGYFHGVHELPRSMDNSSNEKEMIFITTYKPSDLSDSEWLSIIKGTLAHEFQHLIFFNNRILKYNTEAEYNSEIWINEGLSMVAEDLVIMGGPGLHNSDLDLRVKDYLANSAGNSLCTWGNTVADYSPAYMFMRYYVDRFTESIIGNLINSSYTGNNMLTKTVATSTYQPDFKSLFRDWLATVVLDRLNYTALPEYSYKTIDLSNKSSYPYMFLRETGSMVIPDTTGAFIYQEGLTTKQQITVKIYGNPVFGLRLIMLPAPGQSFTIESLPNLIKVR